MLGRRGFLGALTASLAVAGSTGCRRAVEQIVPYAAAPEQIIPGRPLHYATTYARGADAIGVVVESHEGRPTKVEGNALHPASLGAADSVTQASILDLYDPDRSAGPTRAGVASPWAAFVTEVKARLSLHEKDGGARLGLLLGETTSPTVQRLRATLAARFPKARAVVYSPLDASLARAGAVLAFGAPARTSFALERAKVIVSLDSDLLLTEPGAVRAQKLFAASRRIAGPTGQMSRLYVVEPALTTTGMAADHRLAIPASDVLPFAIELTAALARQGAPLGAIGDACLKRALDDASARSRWVNALARDLLAAKGAVVVAVGSRQPAEVHALGHAIHDALGAIGDTAQFVASLDAVASARSAEELLRLAAAARRGELDTLLVLGGNPVYDAPVDAEFAEALRAVAFSAHLAPFADETSALCTWHLAEAHPLEAWGDHIAREGTYSLQQPLIRPLHDAKSELEVLALLDGAEADAMGIVRATHASRAFGAGAIGDHAWKSALRDGVLTAAPAPPPPALDTDAVARAIAATPPRDASRGFELVFAPDPKLLDGRHANNSWLEELSDPVTKLVWDNAAVLAPATRSLGVAAGDRLRIEAGGRAIELPALPVPGTAEGVVALTLGWGRTRAGRLGNGRGFDVMPLRKADAMGFTRGASVAKIDGRYALATTQGYDATDGRPVAREATLEEYRREPHFAELMRPPRRSLPLWTDVDYSKGHQWGMTIDLNACTGCNACVVACQSENNIPVVGKEEVARGRSMQWMRLDRYFVEEGEGIHSTSPKVAVQPVTCVQCEEAPCENVCPVAALEHSTEGLSEVTYNRCIGTRYCANNCPYKVRRFNYLNWHNDGVWKETGGLPETLQMQQNPDVTVRFRGIIEKCTYCVQRIQAARLGAKALGRAMEDGDVVTACQQTCPSDAIVFGDLNDMTSRVARLTVGDRRYALLEELGTKPRTTYLARIRNENPELR